MKRRRTLLLSLTVVLALCAACSVWLHRERQHYVLNRRLIAALVHRDDKQALTLVNAGADPNTCYAPTPVPSLLQLVKRLFHHAPPPTKESPTALLIACGAWWNDEGATMQIQSNRPDDAPLVQAMLAHGANANAQDKHSMTPLIWVFSSATTNPEVSRHRKTVMLLLEHGANVNAQYETGATPLMMAVGFSSPDVIDLLLERGAKVDAQDKDGETALMAAVSCFPEDRSVALVHLLLEQGANANAQNKYGNTALSTAVYDGYRQGREDKAVGELLAHGANPNLAAIDGMTLYRYAQNRCPDIAALLRRYGARK